MMQKTLKTYLALAVMAAAVSMAAGARQLQQIDVRPGPPGLQSRLVSTATDAQRRPSSPAAQIPEAGLLSTGVDIGTSVFVPSVPFLDFGSVVTGLLQGPISAGGEFLDTVGSGRPVPPR